MIQIPEQLCTLFNTVYLVKKDRVREEGQDRVYLLGNRGGFGNRFLLRTTTEVVMLKEDLVVCPAILAVRIEAENFLRGVNQIQQQLATLLVTYPTDI